MTDLGALFVGLAMLALAGTSFVFLRPRLTVATVFNGVWGVLLMMQGLATPITDGIPPLVLGVIGLAGFTVAASTVGVQLLARRRARDAAPLRPLVVTGRSLQLLVRGHLVLTAMLVGYTVAQILALMPYIDQAGGIVALFTPGSGAAREMKGLLAQNSNSGEPFSGSLWGAALSYLLYMGNAALFTGGILAALGKWWVGLIPLAVNAVFSLVSFQRTSFIVGVLLTAFAWLLARNLVARPASVDSAGGSQVAAEHAGAEPVAADRRRWPRGRVIGATAALLAAGLVLLVPIQLRNASTGDAAGVLSLAQYAFGSIAGFGARVSPDGAGFVPPLLDGTAAVVPGLGAYTFTKAFGVLAKLGLPVTEVPYTYDYYSTLIFGRDFSTNTATLLYDLVLDGGAWWLVGFLAVFSSGATWLQTARRAETRLVTLPLVAFALATMAWSFFVATLLRDTRNLLVAVVAAGLLAFWLRSRRTPAADDANAGEPSPSAESDASESVAVQGE